MIKTPLLALFITFFVLTSCKKDNNIPVNKPGISVSLDKSSMSLFLGNDDMLHATISTGPATFTWETSNDLVATVNDGKVIAIGKGTATITVKTADGNSMASCKVTVTDMSSTIGGGLGYLLLNDSTEQVRVAMGNTSPYDMIITRYAIYSTKDVLISDKTLNADSLIIIHPPITVITSDFSVGVGNLNKFEPGNTKGVVFWKVLIYFDYNSKHYKMSMLGGVESTFSIQ